MREAGVRRVMVSRCASAFSLAVVVLVIVLTAGVAVADRKPNEREQSKITAALDRAGFSCDIFPGARCRRTIRVSTVNESWAAGYIKGDSSVQSAAASLKRNNHRWHVHQVGNGGGCDVPDRVANDLHLGCV